MLEVDVSCKLYSERTDIRSCHEVVLVSRYVLDEIGRTDAARATLLVEDVDNVYREAYVLVHVIVDTAECFPTSVEVEAVGLVDVLLALIAEACPYAELVELIARVELDDCLAHAGSDLVVEVVLLGCAVAEVGCDVEVLVLRVLQCQQSVEGESLERSEHYVGGLAHSLYVVGDGYFHYVRRVVGVGELCAALVI